MIGGEADGAALGELGPMGDLVARDVALPTLAAVLARCRRYYGHDTGISHLAAAVGIPCIGLHGTTRPEESGAYGEKHQVVQARYQSGTARERRKASNDAMREITAEAVCAACDSVLEAGTNGHRRSAAA